MFCPNCGESNPDGANFCAKCAARLTPATGEQPAEAPAAPPAAPPAPPTAPPTAPPQQQWTPPQQGQTTVTIPTDVGKIFFVPRLIEYVSQGGLFRRITAVFLIVASVIAGIAGAVMAFGLAAAYFDFGGAAIIGALLSFPLAVFATYMQVHTLTTRAKHIRELEGGEYTVIPIVSILFRLSGELTLIGLVHFGLQAMFAAWFMGQSLLGSPFGGYGYGYGYGGGYGGGGESFIGGIVVFLGALIAGFVSLIIYYLLSELVVVVVDIARNVKALRTAGESK